MVIILRGVSGSGKSTATARYNPDLVVSADHFMVDKEGRYNFDVTRLSECHSKCLLTFLDFVASHSNDSIVVVDNTNTTLWETSPYVQSGNALGHVVKVISLLSDPEVAAARNQHGVPPATVFSQDQRLRSSCLEIPSHWNHEVLNV